MAFYHDFRTDDYLLEKRTNGEKSWDHSGFPVCDLQLRPSVLFSNGIKNYYLIDKIH